MENSLHNFNQNRKIVKCLKYLLKLMTLLYEFSQMTYLPLYWTYYSGMRNNARA